MKIILLILGIVQVSLGQQLPPDHEQNVLKLKTALQKLQNGGITDDAYAFLLNYPNGDQVINQILSSLQAELSPLIGPPGPSNPLSSLIADALLQAGTMESILNGLGYEDLDMYTVIFRNFYREIVHAIEGAAQKIDPTIPSIARENFALPQPTKKPTPEIFAAFNNAIQKSQADAENLKAVLTVLASQPGSENLLRLFLAKIFTLLGSAIGGIAEQSGLGTQLTNAFSENMLEVVEILDVLDKYGVSEEQLLEQVIMKFFSGVLESFGELFAQAAQLPDPAPNQEANPGLLQALAGPPEDNSEQASKVQQITYLLVKSKQDANELKAIGSSLNLNINLDGDVFGPVVAPLLGTLNTQGQAILAQQTPENQARLNTAIQNIIYDITGLKQVLESENVDWDVVLLGFIPEVLEELIAYLGKLALSKA